MANPTFCSFNYRGYTIHAQVFGNGEIITVSPPHGGCLDASSTGRRALRRHGFDSVHAAKLAIDRNIKRVCAASKRDVTSQMIHWPMVG